MNLKYYLGRLLWIPVIWSSLRMLRSLSLMNVLQREKLLFMQTIHRILRLRLLSLLPA